MSRAEKNCNGFSKMSKISEIKTSSCLVKKVILIPDGFACNTFPNDTFLKPSSCRMSSSLIKKKH